MVSVIPPHVSMPKLSLLFKALGQGSRGYCTLFGKEVGDHLRPSYLLPEAG